MQTCESTLTADTVIHCKCRILGCLRLYFHSPGVRMLHPTSIDAVRLRRVHPPLRASIANTVPSFTSVYLHLCQHPCQHLPVDLPAATDTRLTARDMVSSYPGLPGRPACRTRTGEGCNPLSLLIRLFTLSTQRIFSQMYTHHLAFGEVYFSEKGLLL